jgi:two-component system OmpR family sensor kinase
MGPSVVRGFPSRDRPPIFIRTFWLVFASMLVAEIIGFALLADRRLFSEPPPGPPPPPYEQVALEHGELGLPLPPPPPPPAAPRPPPPGGVLGLGVVLLFPLSWMFAQAVASPVRRFAEATHAAADSLNSTRERLNRVLRERTHMIAGIANDLHTPLTRLAYRLEDVPEPLRGKVQTDIDQMRSMLSAALEFIRDRVQEGLRHPVDFRLLVESVIDEHTAAGHDVSFDAGPAVTLNCDPLALRLVAANLIDNALKYGKRARLRLRADQRVPTVGEGPCCVLEVDDDGPGIPTLLQDQVFEPFFRAQGPRNPQTGGIGLGLTTVRSIVVDHGGEISLHNRPDGGLRVLVTLPVA